MSKALDIKLARKQFPVTEQMLYLDSAHQTPLANDVHKALAEFLEEANQHAGPKPVWMSRVETARKKTAQFFNAKPSEIAFTKNTSEGLNIAANAVPLGNGDTVLLLEGDHPNNAYAWLNLRRKGVQVKFIPLADNKVATAETFAAHIDKSVKVISLSHMTFHAGQRHDIESIGKLCTEHGLYLVVDAMQSVGVLPLDVKKLGVSVLAAGTHKGLLVPQGLGILYVKDGLDELQPAYLAMSSLENPPDDYIARPDDVATRKDAGRFEFGNYNLPNLHALSSAIDLITQFGTQAIEQHVLSLGSHLLSGLDEIGVAIVGPRESAHRAHIYVLELPVSEWADYFSKENVRVSPERGGIRISFSFFNSLEDVNQVLRLIAARKGVSYGPAATQTKDIELTT